MRKASCLRGFESRRGYLGAHFRGWRTLEVIDINAGDHVKVRLSRADRRIRILLRACGQCTRDGGVRTPACWTPIYLVALQIGGWARLPRDVYGVRRNGWRGRRGRRTRSGLVTHGTP